MKSDTKCEYIFCYKPFRILYTSLWYYGNPFLVLALQYVFPIANDYNNFQNEIEDQISEPDCTGECETDPQKVESKDAAGQHLQLKSVNDEVTGSVNKDFSSFWIFAGILSCLMIMLLISFWTRRNKKEKFDKEVDDNYKKTKTKADDECQKKNTETDDV